MRPVTAIATVATIATVVLAVVGCDGADDRSGGSAVIVTTTAPRVATTLPVTVPVTGPGTLPVTGPGTLPETLPVTVGEPAVTSRPVAQLDSPVALAVRPGDSALYVVEQPGRVVRMVPSGAGDRDVRIVADVSDRVEPGGERGLLGLAFAGDGTRAWLHYTDNDGDTVVAEYPVAADGAFDVSAERVLLALDQPYSNHNGGDLALGPDGMLYVALGDGGSANDPERRASDPTSLLGKLLRIDPTPSGDGAYTIPPDNPFAGGPLGGQAGAGEVWAWGLRNPWRIAFDPVTGDLWIADVGQNRYEEVNRVQPSDGRPAGWAANFGWSAYEGTVRLNEDVADPGDLVLPVLTYEHGDIHCAVSGGAVYRGSAIPELEPAYVYSDYCSGIVWALDLAGARNLTLLDGFAGVTAVRAGPDGELYVLEHGGTIHQLVAA